MEVKRNVRLIMMGIFFSVLAGIVQCGILLSILGLEFSDIRKSFLIMMWGVLSVVTGFGVWFNCS